MIRSYLKISTRSVQVRIRKLQLLTESNTWLDDAYAYEDETDQVIFHYNLDWGRMGSFYSTQLKKFGATLEDVETIIYPTKGMRWLPIEEIDDDKINDHLARLEAIHTTSLVTKRF